MEGARLDEELVLKTSRVIMTLGVRIPLLPFGGVSEERGAWLQPKLCCGRISRRLLCTG